MPATKWVLVDVKTGIEVSAGAQVTDHRGDSATLAGDIVGQPPAETGKSGYIYTQSGRRYYPTVYGLEWRQVCPTCGSYIGGSVGLACDCAGNDR